VLPIVRHDDNALSHIQRSTIMAKMAFAACRTMICCYGRKDQGDQRTLAECPGICVDRQRSNIMYGKENKAQQDGRLHSVG
jgi:hypothetical protein